MRLSSNPLEQKVCFRSNLNKAGKERRRRIALFLAVFGALFLVSSRLLRLSFWTTFVPLALFCTATLFVWLEVTRQTCVMLASKDIREIDGDKPYERVRDEQERAATKAVAVTIWRDSIALGTGIGFVLTYVASFF